MGSATPAGPAAAAGYYGHSYKTAAAGLRVRIHTIRFQVRNIYEKLHVHSKLGAVLKATREGLID